MRRHCLPPGAACCQMDRRQGLPRRAILEHSSFRAITGHLDAANGDRFGFELTFFRFALTPPSVAVTAPGSQPSAWRSHELFMAHFAVSDVARQRFRFSQKLSREALGLAV